MVMGFHSSFYGIGNQAIYQQHKMYFKALQTTHRTMRFIKIPLYRFSENRIKFMMHNQFSKKNIIEAIFPYHIFPHYTMLKYILFKTLIICWKNTHKILKRINFLVLCVTEKHKNCYLPFMYCLYIWKKIFFWNNKFLK